MRGDTLMLSFCNMTLTLEWSILHYREENGGREAIRKRLHTKAQTRAEGGLGECSGERSGCIPKIFRR